MRKGLHMIELWDGYVIGADAYQFILGKRRTSKNKARQRVENRIREATYHPTLPHALVAFHRMKLRKYVTNETLTLADVIAAALEIEQRIMEKVPDLDRRLFVKVSEPAENT